MAGEIVGLYWGNIGMNMNNLAKLKALIVELNMGITNGWLPIIIEGDS